MVRSRHLATWAIFLLAGVAGPSSRAQDIPADIDGMASVQTSRVGQFDVQGIKLGMPLKQATDLLSKKGYQLKSNAGGMVRFTLGNNEGARDFDLQSATLDGQSFVSHIMYAQRFTGGFDKATLQAQVIAKYGEASKVEPSGNATLLQYFDQTETVNTLASKANQQCYGEIVASGVPGYQAIPLAQQSVHMSAWAMHGDTKARKNCPKTLGAYHASIKAYYAPQMTVGIGRDINKGTASQFPSTLSISLHAKGLADALMLKLAQEQREKQSATPAVKADL